MIHPPTVNSSSVSDGLIAPPGYRLTFTQLQTPVPGIPASYDLLTCMGIEALNDYLRNVDHSKVYKKTIEISLIIDSVRQVPRSFVLQAYFDIIMRMTITGVFTESNAEIYGPRGLLGIVLVRNPGITFNFQQSENATLESFHSNSSVQITNDTLTTESRDVSVVIELLPGPTGLLPSGMIQNFAQTILFYAPIGCCRSLFSSHQVSQRFGSTLYTDNEASTRQTQPLFDMNVVMTAVHLTAKYWLLGNRPREFNSRVAANGVHLGVLKGRQTVPVSGQEY